MSERDDFEANPRRRSSGDGISPKVLSRTSSPVFSKLFSRRRRLDVITAAYLIALLVAIWSAHLPVFDPDESLFALIVRSMRQTGDWLTPVKEGQPFFDRPAPYFWLLAVSEMIFGENEFALRLPSVLLGVTTIVFTGRLAQAVAGRAAGAPSRFMFATSAALPLLLVMIGNDVALVASTTAAVALGYARLFRPAATAMARHWQAVAVGVAMGLGVLAKGLLGIALPMLAVAPAALMNLLQDRDLTPRTRPVRREPSSSLFVDAVIACMTACIVGGWWFAAMAWKHPGFLEYFIWRRHVLGYVTAGERHGGTGIGVYLLTLAAGTLPWCVVGLAWLWKTWGSGRQGRRRDGAFALACSVALVGLFFAAGKSRQPTYLLPVFPLLAALGAMASQRWERGGSEVAMSRRWRLAVGLCGVQLALVTGCLYFLSDSFVRERSARELVRWLRDSGPSPESAVYAWFDDLPPSAEFYGPFLQWRKLRYEDLGKSPDRETLLVVKESRLRYLSATPFCRLCERLDAPGPFIVLRCRPASVFAHAD